MPRKAKNRVFKGTPWWAIPKVKRNESVGCAQHTAGSSSATHRPKVQHDLPTEMYISEVHHHIESKDTGPKSFQEIQNSERRDKTVDSDLRPSVKGTASGKILKPHHRGKQFQSLNSIAYDTISIKHNITSSTNINTNTVSVEGDKVPSGYRLIHLLGLEAAVNGLHKCETGTLKLKEDVKARQAFSSLLFFKCSICLKRTYLQESNHNHSSTYGKEMIQQMLASGSIKEDDKKRKRLADQNKSERGSRKSKLGQK